MIRFKLFKWLVDLAARNPILFAVTLLMFAVVVLGKVIIDRDHKIGKCEEQNSIYQKYCNSRADSIEVYYKARVTQLTDRVEQILEATIGDYKRQLEEQKNLNKSINTAIIRNQKILKTAKDKLEEITSN